jgi:hypothetical protein
MSKLKTLVELAIDEAVVVAETRDAYDKADRMVKEASKRRQELYAAWFEADNVLKSMRKFHE